MMTLEKLADICHAMDAAIQDVYVEYERDRDPPYDLNDITGEIVAVPTGPRRLRWATARPFSDRFLFEDSSTWMDARGAVSHVTEKRSENGKWGKHLELRYESDSGYRFRPRGTITGSHRFILPCQITPTPFTILRCQYEQPDYPLSEAMRKTEGVQLASDLEKVGEFGAVRVDFYREDVRNRQGDRVPTGRMYFSIDHAYTPIRFELFNGGRMVKQETVTELESVAPGIWYPKSGLSTTWDRNGRSEESFWYEASKILVNQGLHEDSFDISFPPGTKVVDERPLRDRLRATVMQAIGRNARRATTSRSQ